MDPNFEDRSAQLPSPEEARMNLEQRNASLGKTSDVETAYSGEAASEHDQLPSVHDIHMHHTPSRSGRCKTFLLAAFVVVAVVILTVALVVTQAGTEDDEFNAVTGSAYENSNHNVPTTTLPSDTQDTSAPQQPAQPSTPANTVTPPPGRLGDIVQLLSDRGVSTMVAMTTPGTPQQKACAWIADYDTRKVSLDNPDSLIQRYVMAVFFDAMGGEVWTNKLNFLSREDECKWYVAGFAGDNKQLKQFGITCNDDGKVQAIHFPSNFLVGAFPSEMKELKSLERFDVFNNGGITGGFPEFFRGLPKINFIGLHYCGLQGQLPEWLGELTTLKSLVLSNNGFSGPLPSTMSSLVNLEDMYLDDNKLQGDISMLQGLSKIKNMVLEDNQFQGSMSGALVGSWPEIEVFDASHNMLNGNVPAAFFELNDLRVLDLHQNQFYGPLPAPSSLKPSLQIFTINENALTGQIPGEINHFINLNTLDLSSNQFTNDIPETIGNLASLEYLFLALNDFTPGAIPMALSNLVSLKQLSLKGTKRTGSIPAWIGNLNQLILLDLDGNSLTGALPASLGSLSKMEYLLLNRNQLEGYIPETFSSMSGLRYFMIDQNKLSGSAAAVCQNEDSVEMFIADCQGSAPEVDCPCCNVCCSDGNAKCNDDVWLGDSNPIWELGFERPGVELDAAASRSYTVQFAGEIP